jgi:environmental stress-induced protein Ves
MTQPPSSFYRIKNADYKRMPWRNKAGYTTEVVVFPENSALENATFLWRASVAEINRDSSFSRFPGYDRHLLIIDGRRMVSMLRLG